MAKRAKPTASAKPPVDDGDDSIDQKESSEKWLKEIDQSLAREKTWRDRAKEVVKRFRDERSAKSAESKVNILWSNTEVLKAALYSRQAKPDVRRRFPDGKKGNSVSRFAAEAVERGLIYCADVYDVDTPLEAAVEDMLLPGRGQCSIDYDPKIEHEGKETEYVGEQTLRIRYHYWEDFCHGLARQWCDVPWVAFRHAMRKSAFEKKFPDVKREPDASLYEMKTVSGQSIETTDNDKFIEVWEIWDKPTKRRLYIARGYGEVLKSDEDPLTFTGFFPCPEPLYSVTTTDTLLPEPEFCQYQDQAIELDVVSTRIRKLTEQLKWKGIYDGSIDPSQNGLKALADADDGDFIAYQNWGQLKEKGGIENAVGFWPMERITQVLTVLDLRQASLIQKIYEITGISDIVRGATDPRETKGAQQLKAQFGSMRMQRRQRDVQRFIRDLYRLKAEVIAEHFTSDNLREIASLGLPTRAELALAQNVQPPMMPGGLPQLGPVGSQPLPAAVPPSAAMGGVSLPPGVPPPSAPAQPQAAQSPPTTWDDVMEVLRSDKMRGYRIDIETDSTVLQDAEVEKAQRIEAATALRDSLQAAYVAATTAPKTLPLIKESTLFVMRTFKAGRSMEQAVEDAFDELTNNPPAPPPDKQAKPDTTETDKAKLALEAEKAKAANENERAKLAIDAEDRKAKLGLEQQRLQIDAGDKAARLQVDREKMRAAEMREEQNAMANVMSPEQVQMERLKADRDYELEVRRIALEERKTGIEDGRYQQDRSDRGLPDIAAVVGLAEQLAQRMAAQQQEISQMVQANTAAVMQQSQQISGAISNLGATVDGLASQIGETQQSVRAIAEQEAAPVEIVARTSDGKVKTVRKGSVTRDVRRGPDGKAMGLQ